MTDKSQAKVQQTLVQLVTCPRCLRLLSQPRALSCGVCYVCEACCALHDAGDGPRCRCGLEATKTEVSAPLDPTRRHLVRLYAQLASLGQRPADDDEIYDDNNNAEAVGLPSSTTADDDTATPETEAGVKAESPSRCRLERLLGNRGTVAAVLERRLNAWERAHRAEAEATAAALAAAEAAISDARRRLAEAADAGRDAVEAARSRVRAAAKLPAGGGAAAAAAASTVGPDLLRLPASLPPPPGRLARWAAGLTDHLTEGLLEASVRVEGCRPAEPPLIGRRLFALAGFRAVAACYVACTVGYHSDAGGRVFEANPTTTEPDSKLEIVGSRCLPPACVAILMRRRGYRRPRHRHRHSSTEAEAETHGEVATNAEESRIILVDSCSDSSERAPSAWLTTPMPAPLRLAGCPVAPQLFLLMPATAEVAKDTGGGRRRQRLLVCQCGLDGRPAQTAELRDFQRDVNDDEGIDHCYDDVRIECDARQVVVFSSGCQAFSTSATGTPATSVVVLLDRTSLRVIQRLRLPDGASALHATPTLVWMRRRPEGPAGEVSLVSLISRQVGRDWPAEGLRGLFYASDATEVGGGGGSGLAVATENCVRLFDGNLQPLCRIVGSVGQGYRLRYPVAVCRWRCNSGDVGGGGCSVLAVCDAVTEEVLMFALD